jgi:hypothetical protein
LQSEGRCGPSTVGLASREHKAALAIGGNEARNELVDLPAKFSRYVRSRSLVELRQYLADDLRRLVSG